MDDGLGLHAAPGGPLYQQGLRNKRSQRFTVAHHPNAIPSPPPEMPNIMPHDLVPQPQYHPPGFAQSLYYQPPPNRHPWPREEATGMFSPIQHQQQQPQPTYTGVVADDDIIPTAIVIKNIPFTVKREQLLQIIDDLSLVPPYAFNYHFDSGIFRGLAFANFRTASETDACVVALNGFEIAGRRLRVEYKKVLKEGEKERIERDKALKRMRSLQMDRSAFVAAPGPPPPLPHGFGQPQPQPPQQQYDPYAQYNPSSQAYHNRPMQQMQMARGDDSSASAHEEWEDYGRVLPPSAFQNYGVPMTITGSNPISPPTQSSSALDMNDPQTLELYSRVLIFKDDALRDDMAFSKSLTTAQRRIVHQIAKKLGLDHRSTGHGDERHVIVFKSGRKAEDNSSTESKSLRHAASAYGSTRLNAAHLSPDATSANLRKKSMPDLRSTGSSGSSTSPTSTSAMSTPFGNSSMHHSNSSGVVGGQLAARRSNADLRQQYSLFDQDDAPAVPPLPISLSTTALSHVAMGTQRTSSPHSTDRPPSSYAAPLSGIHHNLSPSPRLLPTSVSTPNLSLTAGLAGLNIGVGSGASQASSSSINGGSLPIGTHIQESLSGVHHRD